MARKEALLRLHERLVAQRDELRRKLAVTYSELEPEVGGDSGDLAFHGVERELETQLASLESRELARIEQAIEAIQNGTYGRCEYCEAKIPIARLRALPHTSCCITCQRKYEDRRTGGDITPNWESAWEYQARQTDGELSMRDIHIEIE